jgi:hydroxymethylglutaryl-CoA reductase (NADPH)
MHIMASDPWKHPVAGRETIVQDAAQVPMKGSDRWKIAGPEIEAEVRIPLATYETPLWPSVARGAKATAAAGGIRASVVDERMARSIVLEAADTAGAAAAAAQIAGRRAEVAAAAEHGSRFAKFLDLHIQICGSLLFVPHRDLHRRRGRHNMATRAGAAGAGLDGGGFPALRPYPCRETTARTEGLGGPRHPGPRPVGLWRT